MTDASALLAAIRAAPTDDAPRLVYADWLDEHGQPERAEFIRVQCELARRVDPALRRREAELMAAHHDEFVGPLAAPHLRFRFRRGFIVGFGHTGVFAATVSNGGAPTHSFLLRFHPHRSVESSFTHVLAEWQVKQLAPEQFAVPARTGRGKYVLDPFGEFTGIRFTCRSEDGNIDYCGALVGDSIDVEGFNHFSGEQFRRRYIHYPIPGFSSFPET